MFSLSAYLSRFSKSSGGEISAGIFSLRNLEEVESLANSLKIITSSHQVSRLTDALFSERRRALAVGL